MFIVWGKKHVYRKLGFASDFCPLCRKVRSFQLQRIGLAGHIYYVSAGQGALIGYARKCTTCKTVLNANPDLYREISKKALDPAALQRLTFPNLLTHHADRLALEQKIAQSLAMVSPHERLALIREPFALLSPSVEKRFSSTHIDKETGLTLLAALLLLPMVAAATKELLPNYQGEVAVGLLLLGVVAVVVQGIRSGGRFFKQKIFPVLVPALRPLKPAQDELAAVIGEMKKAKAKFGTKLKLGVLMEKLKA